VQPGVGERAGVGVERAGVPIPAGLPLGGAAGAGEELGWVGFADTHLAAGRDRRGEQDLVQQRVRVGAPAEENAHHGGVTLAVLVDEVGFDIGMAAVDLVLARRMEVVLGELIGVLPDAQRIGDARRDQHLDHVAGVSMPSSDRWYLVSSGGPFRRVTALVSMLTGDWPVPVPQTG
jgi:hypothetical protein